IPTPNQENSDDQQHKSTLPSIQLTQEQRADPRYVAYAEDLTEIKEAVEDLEKHVKVAIQTYDLGRTEKILAEVETKADELLRKNPESFSSNDLLDNFKEIKDMHTDIKGVINYSLQLLPLLRGKFQEKLEILVRPCKVFLDDLI
ncbi:hypothetical protein ENBRE01_3112, partial [Enteropsectra breve]